VNQPAATIVTEAAAILDEEMARGVLAARDATDSPRGRHSDHADLVRQVHDVIDNLATAWPSLQGAASPWSNVSEAPACNVDDDPLPELKPASAVRPGQRAMISMLLCNKESRSVRLVPAATDLVGAGGGRIPSHLLEFVPREARLEAGQQQDAQIAVTIPRECAPDCYYGLLVVSGADALRAVIAITVT
jgi:hypothetical protein